MVNEKFRIQLAIKEILIKEIWKHLKSNCNFDVVLSIASLIEPFDEGPDPCYEDCPGMCFGCYDGTQYSIDWRATYNLRTSEPFSLLTEHELDFLIDALNGKQHKCDEWCSSFVCYKYEAKNCAVEKCFNLFLKTRINMKYCSMCRNGQNIIVHAHYRELKDWDCYCKKLVS